MADLPTFPLTVKGVRRAVGWLDAADSYDLAARLEDARVKGVIGNECACVLARALERLLPGVDNVFVEAETVRVSFVERDSWGFDMPVTLSVQLPDGAQDLVQEFDRGEHPELIEEVKTDADPAA